MISQKEKHPSATIQRILKGIFSFNCYSYIIYIQYTYTEHSSFDEFILYFKSKKQNKNSLRLHFTFYSIESKHLSTCVA